MGDSGAEANTSASSLPAADAQFRQFQLIGIQQLRHQVGDAAARPAHVDAPAAQLR
jgi:hypothetical protein